jgi:hypothetical protein
VFHELSRHRAQVGQNLDRAVNHIRLHRTTFSPFWRTRRRPGRRGRRGRRGGGAEEEVVVVAEKVEEKEEVVEEKEEEEEAASTSLKDMPSSLQNLTTRSCTLLRLWRGICGKRWCSTWF